MITNGTVCEIVLSVHNRPVRRSDRGVARGRQYTEASSGSSVERC
ncbi:MAG: hypothetical protein ACR2JH_03840 [Solirubrobacteraceae bacterium]